MTVNKAQGQTMSKVVLALAKRPSAMAQSDLSFEGLYVALTRVKNANDLRIMLPDNPFARDLSYIDNLKPLSHVQSFFAGYRSLVRDPIQSGQKQGCHWDIMHAFHHLQTTQQKLREKKKVYASSLHNKRKL
jgi:hypothetical protein